MRIYWTCWRRGRKMLLDRQVAVSGRDLPSIFCFVSVFQVVSFCSVIKIRTFFSSVQFCSRWAERSRFSCSSNITAAYLCQGMLSFVASWAEELMCGYIAVSVTVWKSIFTVFCKELKDFHHWQISWQPDCVLVLSLSEFSGVLKVMSHPGRILRLNTHIQLVIPYSWPFQNLLLLLLLFWKRKVRVMRVLRLAKYQN